MRYLAVSVIVLAALWPAAGISQDAAPSSAPYKILKTARVGGDGGFDYISADVAGRRLYTPRNGPMGHLAVFNLDTLEASVGDIPRPGLGRRGGGSQIPSRLFQHQAADHVGFADPQSDQDH